MLVVSDTSPISNLIQVELLDLLHLLYGQIIIPKAVYEELCEIQSQKELIDNLNWIHIEIAQNISMVQELENDLDKGESESIALAIELNADFLIIDELKGRKIAETHGIKIVGLLGSLLKAKEKGYIKMVSPILEKLTNQAGFYTNPQLKTHLLKLADEL
jgi:uncharacterized protein